MLLSFDDILSPFDLASLDIYFLIAFVVHILYFGVLSYSLNSTISSKHFRTIVFIWFLNHYLYFFYLTKLKCRVSLCQLRPQNLPQWVGRNVSWSSWFALAEVGCQCSSCRVQKTDRRHCVLGRSSTNSSHNQNSMCSGTEFCQVLMVSRINVARLTWSCRSGHNLMPESSDAIRCCAEWLADFPHEVLQALIAKRCWMKCQLLMYFSVSGSVLLTLQSVTDVVRESQS